MRHLKRLLNLKKRKQVDPCCGGGILFQRWDVWQRTLKFSAGDTEGGSCAIVWAELLGSRWGGSAVQVVEIFIIVGEMNY